MRKFVLALAAAASVATPLVIASEASAQNRGYDNREWRGDRGRDNGRWDNNRGRDDRRWDNNRGRDDRRWDNNRGRWDNDWNNGRRNNGWRGNDRWDNRYNGYYLGNRWYYGQPQVTYYSRYDYRPGYRAWQRGGYLPPAYRGYVVYDYPRYRLRPPPRGYHWVQHNNDYILAAIATGLILEVITR